MAFQRYFKRCECVWWSNFARTDGVRISDIINQTVQHKEKISDQASVCVHRGETEMCKYFVCLHALFGDAIIIYATQVCCWSMWGEGAWWGFQFCHRRELPQVSFLSPQTFYRCNTCLSRQRGVFLAKNTKACLSRQTYFVSTKLLSPQIFVAINIIVVHQKFVATSLLLSRQTRICRD